MFKNFSFFIPGIKSATFGCLTSRKNKFAIFKVPAKDDEYRKEWRIEFYDVITRNRVKTHQDKDLGSYRYSYGFALAGSLWACRP